MAGPFSTIDVICARRQALIYVSSPVCEVDFSSSGEPSIILNPFRRRRGPTGFRLIVVNGRIRFRWDTSDGIICYSLYRREGGEYVLVAECVPCEACDPPEAGACCYECEDCPPGCYVVTAISEDGETEPSEEICIDSFPTCEVTITTPSPLPPGDFNAPYSQQLDQEFGLESTEQWSIISGALPAGLTLSPSGLISGTPTDGGNFAFTAQVFAMCDDVAAGENSKAFLLNIQGGPEPTCILRIQDYDTVTQPLFIGHTGSPISTDLEWDGVWNFISPDVPLPVTSYRYKGSNGISTANPGIGPNIAVGGRGVSQIILHGPFPASGSFAFDWWEIRIIYFAPADIPKRTWQGYKIGGFTTTPVGLYVSGMIVLPATFPPGTFSDNRASVTVELCP